MKVLPRPCTLASLISPPNNTASSRLIAKPKPVPPYFLEVPASACWKASKIKRCFSGATPIPVSSTAKAIYTDHSYGAVLWAGHSLGSVVSYDGLNAALIDDEIAGRPDQVVARTKLLLTFGSPLDKIAFIFASQLADTTATREALSASFQPLIMDYPAFRDIKWINVYSPNDLFSGALDFYDSADAPGRAGREVINLVDEQATTPILAHVEYWKNSLLYAALFEHIKALVIRNNPHNPGK